MFISQMQLWHKEPSLHLLKLLTAFFTLWQEDAFARTLMYSEVPTYYMWNVTKKSFIRCRRGEPVDSQPGSLRENTIGRLYTVHLNLDECFFLRMLSVNVPGLRSFQQLKIVDGVTLATSCAACHALNLLEIAFISTQTMEKQKNIIYPQVLQN